MAEPAPPVLAMPPGPVRRRRRGTGTTRRIWELAWPAAVTNLLQSLVGFVDIKIVGALGAPAVAAVTTGERLFFVEQILLIALGVGTTALVARAWGGGDRAEAERTTRTSLWLSMGIAALLTVPGVLLAHPMAAIFQLDAKTTELAAGFIRWVSLFNVPFAVFVALGTALRAVGDMHTPLRVGALTNALNVLLAWALVYGRLGLPALGVTGAAIANGLAYSFAAAVMVLLWVRRMLRLGVGPAGGDLDQERIRRLVRIGTPAGLEQAAVQAGFIAFLWIVALYGTDPYAAYGIGVSILSFSFLIGLGFSIAASTLVGQHLGAGEPEAAARSGWRAMALSMGAMVVFGSGIAIFAGPIARFMIQDPKVVHYTVFFIHVLASVQVLMAIEFALGGALRGAGDTRFPLLTVLAGLVAVRISLAGIFAWLGWPVEWIFAALIADYAVKSVLYVARFRGGRWKTAVA